MDFNSLLNDCLGSIVSDFVFAIPARELSAFLDHYGFDDSLRLRSRLIPLCARPCDIFGFAFALYMLAGPDCKLQTQKDIAAALIDYERNDFTL